MVRVEYSTSNYWVMIVGDKEFGALHVVEVDL